jgi:hypothetical protein
MYEWADEGGGKIIINHVLTCFPALREMESAGACGPNRAYRDCCTEKLIICGQASGLVTELQVSTWK